MIRCCFLVSFAAMVSNSNNRTRPYAAYPSLNRYSPEPLKTGYSIHSIVIVPHNRFNLNPVHTMVTLAWVHACTEKSLKDRRVTADMPLSDAPKSFSQHPPYIGHTKQTQGASSICQFADFQARFRKRRTNQDTAPTKFSFCDIAFRRRIGKVFFLPRYR